MPVAIQILLFLVSNWREIFQLVKAIAELIRGEKNSAVRKTLTADLTSAVKVFQKSGDKRPLENMLCRLHGYCRKD